MLSVARLYEFAFDVEVCLGWYPSNFPICVVMKEPKDAVMSRRGAFVCPEVRETVGTTGRVSA